MVRMTNVVASRALAVQKLSPIASKPQADTSFVGKATVLGLRDRLIKAFQDNGLTANDLTKAIVIHELLGIFMLALTWTLCYHFQISQLPVLQKPLAKISSMMPNVISSNEFLNSRMGVAYCESSCLRKLIRPVTLPTKVIATVKLVQMTSLSRARLAGNILAVGSGSEVRPLLKAVSFHTDSSESSSPVPLLL